MRVTLEEIEHKYTNEEGDVYDSVSHIVGSYKEAFDTVGASISYAEKNGNTPEYWREEWRLNAEGACARGTAFHLLKEDFVKNSAFFMHDLTRSPVQNWELLRSQNPGMTYSDLPEGTYTELTIANHPLKIAGTADRVTILPDGWIDIDDYKTNKEFKTKGWQNWKTGEHRMLKYPADYLHDAHAGHYALQLNIYAWMLSMYGFKIRQLRALHYILLPDDADKVMRGEGVPDVKPAQYIFKYEPERIANIMDHYMENHKVRPTLIYT